MSVVIEARDLYRFFRAGDDETLALRGVSLTVRAGELVAVTGPSGSGKSTLLACLAGLDDPDGGCVWINGQRLSHRPEEERALLRARNVGIVYQSHNLLGHLTVERNVWLARRLAMRRSLRHCGPLRWWRRNGSWQSNRPSHAATLASCKELLASCAIDHRARALPSTLSGGELARAAVAVALANDPVAIIADEPTAELDQSAAEALLELLRARAAAGAAVVIATHSRDVTTVAERSLALRDGSLQ